MKTKLKLKKTRYRGKILTAKHVRLMGGVLLLVCPGITHAVGVLTSHVDYQYTRVSGFGLATVAHIFPIVYSYDIPANTVYPTVPGFVAWQERGCVVYATLSGKFKNGPTFAPDTWTSNLQVYTGMKVLSTTQNCNEISPEIWSNLLTPWTIWNPSGLTLRSDSIVPLQSICTTLHAYNGRRGLHTPNPVNGVRVSEGCGWDDDFQPTCNVIMPGTMNIGPVQRGTAFQGTVTGELQCSYTTNVTASIVIPSGGLLLSDLANNSSKMPYTAKISLGSSGAEVKVTGSAGSSGTPVSLHISGTASVVGDFSDSLIYVISIL